MAALHEQFVHSAVVAEASQFSLQNPSHCVESCAKVMQGLPIQGSMLHSTPAFTAVILFLPTAGHQFFISNQRQKV